MNYGGGNKMILTVPQSRMREIGAEWISKKDHVVEVGCNAGNFAGLMEKKVNSYLGVDVQEDKIAKAKQSYPKMNFKCCDILKNLDILKEATVVASFQTLEHIKEDLKILEAIPSDCIVILSVPNGNYKGHVRWFEIDGWRKRFSKYINIHEEITIQNERKPDKRAFLFKGIRRR